MIVSGTYKFMLSEEGRMFDWILKIFVRGRYLALESYDSSSNMFEGSLGSHSVGTTSCGELHPNC